MVTMMMAPSSRGVRPRRLASAACPSPRRRRIRRNAGGCRHPGAGIAAARASMTARGGRSASIATRASMTARGGRSASIATRASVTGLVPPWKPRTPHGPKGRRAGRCSNPRPLRLKELTRPKLPGRLIDGQPRSTRMDGWSGLSSPLPKDTARPASRARLRCRRPWSDPARHSRAERTKSRCRPARAEPRSHQEEAGGSRGQCRPRRRRIRRNAGGCRHPGALIAAARDRGGRSASIATRASVTTRGGRSASIVARAAAAAAAMAVAAMAAAAAAFSRASLASPSAARGGVGLLPVVAVAMATAATMLRGTARSLSSAHSAQSRRHSAQCRRRLRRPRRKAPPMSSTGGRSTSRSTRTSSGSSCTRRKRQTGVGGA